MTDIQVGNYTHNEALADEIHANLTGKAKSLADVALSLQVQFPQVKFNMRPAANAPGNLQASGIINFHGEWSFFIIAYTFPVGMVGVLDASGSVAVAREMVPYVPENGEGEHLTPADAERLIVELLENLLRK